MTCNILEAFKILENAQLKYRIRGKKYDEAGNTGIVTVK